jgi:hypothetical protein
MSDTEDIAAQIRRLEKQSAAELESRQKNASSAGTKRRQLCARGCHYFKDDPKYLQGPKPEKSGKKKKRGKGASKSRPKHVCPAPCKSSATCPQKDNVEACKRLHASEHRIAQLKLKEKKIRKV